MQAPMTFLLNEEYFSDIIPSPGGNEQLQQFEAENAELLSSPVKSYSVNGVSMTFGGSGLKNVCGVVIPTSVYQLLVQTGLCNPAI